MIENNVVVKVSTYLDYGCDLEEAYELGGAVSIVCDCGYSGYVDVDNDGQMIFGSCDSCDTNFNLGI